MTIEKLRQHHTLVKKIRNDKISPEMQKLHDEVASYINDVDDCVIKEILRYRYLLGYSWTKVTMQFKCDASIDCFRKMAERYLAKHLKKGGAE